MDIATYIEHSLLNPDATIADIEKGLVEATLYGFPAVCVSPLFIKTAVSKIDTSKMQLATVIGFPLGYSVIEAKVAEVIMSILDGTDALHMVINTIAIKNNDWQYLGKELNAIMPIVNGKGKVFNVIIETSLCSKQELITCCEIYGAAGVHAVIAGTGYAEQGTTVETIELLRQHLPNSIKITAASGIKNYSFAMQFINAGASRLICNNGVQIIAELAQQH